MQPILDKEMMRLQEGGILKKLYFDVASPPAPKPLPKLRVDEPLIIEQGRNSMHKTLHVSLARVLPLSTSAKYSDFWTPSPLSIKSLNLCY